MTNLCMRQNALVIKMQINALKNANEMMDEGWNGYTNNPGFQMAEHSFMKKLLDKEYISPFETPFNGGAKPFLYEMYKAMNEEMIKELERRLKELDEQSSSKA